MVALDIRLGWLGGAVLTALSVLSLSGCGKPELPTACQDNLKNVTQLIVVLTDTMDGTTAKIAVLQRSTPTQDARWRLIGTPTPGVVGSAGLGWGHEFEEMHQSGEVVKREGDKRSPAGLYPVGPTFGFDDAPWAGHLALKPEAHLCVDDLNSKHYGKIVSRQVAGPKTHAEDMAAISVYKRGIVVDYPPNASRKSGSCIFFHIWQDVGEGTAGCIASDDARITDLQMRSASAKTAVVIWATSAQARLERCLPGLPRSLFDPGETKNLNQNTHQDKP